MRCRKEFNKECASGYESGSVITEGNCRWLILIIVERKTLNQKQMSSNIGSSGAIFVVRRD
jgi:hypothetical protein